MGRWLLLLLLFACAPKEQAPKANNPETGNPLPAYRVPDQVPVTYYFIPTEAATDAVLQLHAQVADRLKDRLKVEVVPIVYGRSEDEEARNQRAAVALGCAQELGKLSDYLARFGEVRASATEEELVRLASEIGLEEAAFRDCWKRKWENEWWREMRERARQKGVFLFPTVHLGPYPLVGKPDIERAAGEILRRLNEQPGKQDVVGYYVRDSGCTVCRYSLADQAISAFVARNPRIFLLELDARDPEVARFLEQADVPRVPALLLAGDVRRLPNYDQLIRFLKETRVRNLYFVEMGFEIRVQRYVRPVPPLPDRNSMGREDAPVHVFEFVDFQCPACASFARRVLPKIKENYIDTGKVRWSIVHFPITQIHQYAFLAAVAAECAAEQGKFWPYHDLLFPNQKELNRELLITLAGRINGIQTSAFQECMERPDIQERVRSDLALADQLDAPGTPTFIVGQYRLASFPYSVFARILDLLAEEAQSR